MLIFICTYHISCLIIIIHHDIHPFITGTTSKHETVLCWYQKMSVPSFGSFIKLMKLPCTGSWVSPARGPGSHGSIMMRTREYESELRPWCEKLDLVESQARGRNCAGEGSGPQCRSEGQSLRSETSETFKLCTYLITDVN